MNPYCYKVLFKKFSFLTSVVIHLDFLKFFQLLLKFNTQSPFFFILWNIFILSISRFTYSPFFSPPKSNPQHFPFTGYAFLSQQIHTSDHFLHASRRLQSDSFLLRLKWTRLKHADESLDMHTSKTRVWLTMSDNGLKNDVIKINISYALFYHELR